MKTIVSVLIFCFVFVSSLLAQDVAGVKFGWSYEKCKPILDQKFDDIDSYQLFEGSELWYMNVTFGGIEYGLVRCFFEDDRLDRIVLNDIQPLSDINIIKTKYNKAIALYKQKYKVTHTYTNDSGYTVYEFKNEGLPYFIVIHMITEASLDGETRAHVFVQYKMK